MYVCMYILVCMYLLCFLVVLGNVSILVQTKHFGMRNDGKTTNVVHIALEVTMGWGTVNTAGRKPDDRVLVGMVSWL